jgi:DNA replication factor GINS
MNLDELRSVRRTERQKDSLQHLRDSFYADAASYIEELKGERQRVADAADDPFSAPEVGRLTDEIETAEEVVEAIYERRVGKVVKLASFAAADMPTDTEGLTTEERRLFDDLVGRITENRQSVLAMLAGEAPSGDADPAGTDAGGDAGGQPEDGQPTPNERRALDATDATAGGTPERGAGSTPERPASRADDAAPPDDVLADAMGGTDAETRTDPPTDEPADEGETRAAPPTPPQEPASTSDPQPETDRTASQPDPEADDADRVTVRLTREVGSIFGVDEREYDLARDDVVDLPTANAEPLLERDAAERLE